MTITFTLPEAASVGSVKLTFTGAVTRVLTLASSQETVGAHSFNFDPANPTAAPQVAAGGAVSDGVYTVTLSYQDVLGNPAASVSATGVTLDTSPLAQWKKIQLGDAVAPDLGDPDGDGLKTLAEYGLILPAGAPSQPPAFGRFGYAEGERLRLILSRDSARNDVSLEVQAADSLLGPWSVLASSTLGAPFTGVGYVSGDDATPGVKTVEVRDTVNVEDAPLRFMRVRVSR